MKSPKSFLQSLDQQKFDTILNDLATTIKESKTAEDLEKCVAISDVDQFKKKELFEYLDKNKDKLLSMDTHTEGEPVVATDAIAPVDSENGKVVSAGEKSGETNLDFEDKEYDVPPHHDTRKDAIAVECVALFTDNTYANIILEDSEISIDMIEEQLQKDVLVVFPEKFNSVLTEATLSDTQEVKRERIVNALKSNKSMMKKLYGDDWESVAYAIATKKALDESLMESTSDMIFKQKTHDGALITITKTGEYFTVKKMNQAGEVVDVQQFSSIDEADAMVDKWM